MKIRKETDKSPHARESEFRNPDVLGSGIQLKEGGIPLTIEIQNPGSTEKEFGIRNPESTS